jgi:hypothetical protein
MTGAWNDVVGLVDVLGQLGNAPDARRDACDQAAEEADERTGEHVRYSAPTWPRTVLFAPHLRFRCAGRLPQRSVQAHSRQVGGVHFGRDQWPLASISTGWSR